MIDINKFEKLADEIISNVKKDEMKTPLQELFEYESDLTNMFDSDVRVAGALLEYIRTNKIDMLKKEYMVIMDAHYAPKYGCFSEDYYNKTFNTKE